MKNMLNFLAVFVLNYRCCALPRRFSSWNSSFTVINVSENFSALRNKCGPNLYRFNILHSDFNCPRDFLGFSGLLQWDVTAARARKRLAGNALCPGTRAGLAGGSAAPAALCPGAGNPLPGQAQPGTAPPPLSSQGEDDIWKKSQKIILIEMSFSGTLIQYYFLISCRQVVWYRDGLWRIKMLFCLLRFNVKIICMTGGGGWSMNVYFTMDMYKRRYPIFGIVMTLI